MKTKESGASLIAREIFSPALGTIVGEIYQTLERTKSGEITPTQASAENASCKHLLQAVALDWMYNKKIREIKQVQAQEPKKLS